MVNNELRLNKDIARGQWLVSFMDAGGDSINGMATSRSLIH